jgi:hypothetical protein
MALVGFVGQPTFGWAEAALWSFVLFEFSFAAQSSAPRVPTKGMSVFA